MQIKFVIENGNCWFIVWENFIETVGLVNSWLWKDSVDYCTICVITGVYPDIMEGVYMYWCTYYSI